MLRSEQKCPTCLRNWADYRVPVTGTGSIQRGDFWIRLGAWIIDYIIRSIVSFPLTLLLAPALGLLTGIAIGLTFNVWFLTQKGGTPGKLLLGLRVVDMEGNLLTPMHAVGRYFSYILSVITLGIGYLMIFGEEHLGLHDRVSGSQVVFANTLPKRQEATEMQTAAQ